MTKYKVEPRNIEVTFQDNEVIVSKTDLKGRITYANNVFGRLAEMKTKELIGQPHSIIRHPDMPRAIFKFLWDTLEQEKEVFALVINMSKTGKYYWVLAHVTPNYNQAGQVTGYHSNRRAPSRKAIETISPIYKNLKAIEDSHTNAKQGLEASFAALVKTLGDLGKTYDEFIWEVIN